MPVPLFPLSSANAAATSRVCVALAQTSAAALFDQSAALSASAPFQELRLDFLADPGQAVSGLRQHVERWPALTLIATCRRVASGGRFRGTPEEEVAVLGKAAAAGCRLVDLALESAEQLPRGAVNELRLAGAQVVLSWHDFVHSGGVPQALERMRPFAPDLYKIIPTARTLADTLPLFDLLQQTEEGRQRRIVAVAMGEAGIPSRILGLRAGAAFTFAAVSAEEATAPGQIALAPMQDLYRVAQLGPATALYGVAGDPIRSSRSPQMQNAAFQHTGIDAVYLPLRTNSAEDLMGFAEALGFRGLSVTMPLKQRVMPLLQRLDPIARQIGAVNTLRREADGSLTGFNTDAEGVTAPLQERLPLRGARVLVLGAGGAARAAVFGCVEQGATVAVLNRTPAVAAALAAQSGATALTAAEAAGREFDVLIQATPAGMHGSRAELPLPLARVRPQLVFDLVYNPLETPLLREARRRGIETISGVEMFVHQGARQFELWTGHPAPMDVMRATVLDALHGPGRT